ncbi:MAG: CoA transferase subunit A [Deltaproteobacteria bacterium]|nr:CoA transferase subunit A [Deltaproteobacteria bacterium]
MQEKLMDLKETISRFIQNGDTVAIGGCGRNRLPMALIREVIRQNKKNLHIVGREKGMDFDILIGANCVKKVSFAMVSLEEFGLAMNFRRKIEKGEVEVDEHACYSIISALRAAKMGVPFLPIGGMLESDVLKVNKNMKEISCPFTGQHLVAVKAIKPDVALIHAHGADRYGNIITVGPPFEDVLMAQAAERTIVTVEEILSSEEIRKNPYLTTIPYIYVTALVHKPEGAWPTSCDGFYDSDDEHIKLYAQATKTEEGFKEYLDKYCFEKEE